VIVAVGVDKEERVGLVGAVMEGVDCREKVWGELCDDEGVARKEPLLGCVALPVQVPMSGVSLGG